MAVVRKQKLAGNRLVIIASTIRILTDLEQAGARNLGYVFNKAGGWTSKYTRADPGQPTGSTILPARCAALTSAGVISTSNDLDRALTMAGRLQPKPAPKPAPAPAPEPESTGDGAANGEGTSGV